jgi:hypothetical protein
MINFKNDKENFKVELINTFIKSANRIIKQKGACEDIVCIECRGSTFHNAGANCSINNFSGDEPESNHSCNIAVNSCKRFLREVNMCNNERYSLVTNINEIIALGLEDNLYTLLADIITQVLSFSDWTIADCKRKECYKLNINFIEDIKKGQAVKIRDSKDDDWDNDVFIEYNKEQKLFLCESEDWKQCKVLSLDEAREQNPQFKIEEK